MNCVCFSVLVIEFISAKMGIRLSYYWLVVIACNSQEKDIRVALQYWEKYKSNE